MKNVKINGKWDILLPEHRANRKEWFSKKGWERKRLDSMYEKLTKDDVLYYVGVEEGEMPALCMLWGVKNVVLFEPNKLVWSNVRAVWEGNDLDVPFSFVGFASNKDTKGARLLEGFPECSNKEIITNHGFKELKDPGDIPQIRIDTVQSLHIPPTAISLDVEGSEWEVLKGAEQTLRKYHPKIWLSLHPEFLFDQYGKYSYEVRRWIQKIGYKETLLDYQHEAHFLYE